MPSPKWKLVVDIGEPETLIPVHSNVSVSNIMSVSTTVEGHSQGDEAPMGLDQSHDTGDGRDIRIDQVISLLGEYMPSDPTSMLSSYLPGFMSLRLMLLRPSKTPEEEEMIRTLLGSYSSYSAGGRAKNDTAVMLARDYMFLHQQHQQHPFQHQQQPQQQAQPFLGQGSPNMMQASAPSHGYSFYGLGSQAPDSAGTYNSPALAPIPMSGNNGGDSVSIVST